MPQASIDTRSNEEAFIALLVIAALAFGGLYWVTKTVANYFLGSRLKEDHSGDELCQKPKMSELPRENDTARASTSGIPIEFPKMKDRTYNAKLQQLQSQTPSPQLNLPTPLHNRDQDHATGLSAIRAWEESTTNRIQRQKARKLDQLPALDEPHSTSSNNQEINSILAWEEATMRGFQQEKARRLQRLASIDRQDIKREENVREPVNDWEQAAKRKGAHEKGAQSVRDWELTQKKKRRSRSGGEQKVNTGDDGRGVLWKNGFD